MLLSVCAIVKNEADRIKTFLSKIKKYADEIIIVDNGSSDGTSEILLREKGIIVIESNDSFDLARNRYLERACGEWILNIDIDEEIDEHYTDIMKKMLVQEPDDVSAIIIPRLNYFGNGKWTQWNLPRLIRNSRMSAITDSIHASIAQSALEKGGRLDYIYVPFHHYDALWNPDQSEKRKRNIELIQETLKQKPEKSGIYKNLANEYFALGMSDEAIQIIKKGIEIDRSTNSRMYKGLSNYYYACGRYQESIEAAREQIAIFEPLAFGNDPRTVRYAMEIEACNTLLYKSLYRLGNKIEALALCDKNIREYPLFPHNYMNRYIMSDGKRTQDLHTAEYLNPKLLSSDIYCEKAKADLYQFASSVLEK